MQKIDFLSAAHIVWPISSEQGGKRCRFARFASLNRTMDNLRALLDDVLFIMLLVFVLFLTFGLLSIDEQLEGLNMNAIISLNCLLSQGLLNSLFSYFSDNASVRLNEIAWITYNVRWYEMPLNEQVFVQWIIRRADKIFVLTGAKIFPSSVETMAKVSSPSRITHRYDYSTVQENERRQSARCISTCSAFFSSALTHCMLVLYSIPPIKIKISAGRQFRGSFSI